MDKKIDIAKFIVNRIDYYIEKSDNKASFLLLLNSAIIVFLFSGKEKIMNHLSISNIRCLEMLFYIVILCIFVISIYFSIMVLKPRNSKIENEYKSIFYYKEIASLNNEQYKEAFENAFKDEENLINDALVQIKELSLICDKKMYNVKKSVEAFILGGIILFIYILVVVFNAI
ncbi:TPA: hypothetical protein KOW93_002395 [Clostridioides difficile]|nr:hypothetical protein [Clostridioides difficile]HBF7423315.1 hypothetical protein [Clostridioides difficile]HBG1249697.1 hypothetical protein [Clostridioides difficile]